GYISSWELTLPHGVNLEISAVVDDKIVEKRTLPALPVHAELSTLEEVPRHNPTPPESADLTWRAGALPYTHAILAGHSYQDRPILALELTYPSRASQRKLALWKPTILITARQHANEISSTNAALETARNLATTEHEYLKYMNVILVPMENPDGAYLYSKLAKQNPKHLLHAARYTALGADMQTAIWQTDHPLTEGRVRRSLWSKWRPLVHVNDHGYAGHEWQQPFAGTVPYLFPGWSLPMGAVTIMMHTPSYEDLAQRFEHTIASVFNDLEPDIAIETSKALQQWKRYVGSSSAHVISGLPFLEIVNEKDVESMVFSQRHPSITHLTVVTELPDEGVDPEQLARCIRAHRAQHEGVIRAVLAELKRQGKQVDLQGLQLFL
ncbi:MAG TPA: hypothetical protein ENH11_07865, partial [Candidatus Acetothermia bacterium]|nr:hypothetical protein [Candidatus Acetothermia bacterium]